MKFVKATKSRIDSQFVKYILLFSLVFVSSFFWIFATNKSFISTWDGMPQHYVALAYIGEYLRKLWNSFFAGNFKVWTYDFSIGMGADILQTFNYYGLGDIEIEILSFLVPTRYTEILYGFLVYSKMMFAGICFILLCRELNLYNDSVILGAIMYPFCNFGIESAYGHYFFLNALIFLPLLLIAIERLLIRNKIGYLVFIVLLSFSTNYYFFYMCAIATAIYGIIRGGYFYKGNIKNTVYFICRCVEGTLLGVIISFPISLPAVLGLLNSCRDQGQIILKELFVPNKKLFIQQCLGVIGGPTNWNYLGLSVLIIPSIAILVTSKEMGWLKYKITTILVGCAMIIPLTGFILNGFSYVSYRYLFIISFFACLLLVLVNPVEKEFNQSAFAITSVWLVILIIGSYLDYNVVQSLNMQLESACIFLILAMVILHSSTKHKKILLLCCISLNIVMHVWTSLCPYSNNDQLYHMEQFGKTFSDSTENGILNFKKLEDDTDFYRVSTAADAIYSPNYGILEGQSTTSIYYSILNGPFIKSMVKWENAGVYLLHSFYGMDGRIELENLIASKYYITLDGRTIDIPYGYKLVEQQSGYSLYENTNALPIGFLYSDYILEKYTENYNGIQQANMLYDGIILEESIEGWKSIEVSPKCYRIESEYQIVNGSWTNGNLLLGEAGEITVKFNKIPNCQYYIRLPGYVGENEQQSITISTYKGEKKYLHKGEKSRYYYDSKAVTYNLGYYEDGLSECQIIFADAECATLENIEIWVMPMDVYQAQIDNLSEKILDDITISNNCLEGNVSLEKRGILYLGIPYSKGWRAYDNGEEKEIYRANGGYMGIILQKGTHDIELVYSTPGLKIGIWLSAGALVTIAIWNALKKYRKAKKRYE